MKSGIYQIVNKVTGKRYIGSSQDVSYRLFVHKSKGVHGKHANRNLRFAFAKYGVDGFIFETIEDCEKSKLVEREQFWIDQYDYKTLYNLRPIANSTLGFKHSEETKKIIGEHSKGNSQRINKGERISVETEFKKGQQPWNAGTTGVMKAWNKGIKGSIKPNSGSFQGTVHYRFISPEGEIHEGVSITTFAKERGLNPSHMYEVHQGKYKQHKGWRLAA